MRAVNHALTGAIIGLTVTEPLIAMPLSLGSHYVMDMIPHYRFPGSEAVFLKSSRFKHVLFLDALACVIVILLLLIFRPVHWLTAVACAFIATAPDLASIRRYKFARSNQPFTPNRYEYWATKIQWFERPIGGVVEIAWLIGSSLLLHKLINN